MSHTVNPQDYWSYFVSEQRPSGDRPAVTSKLSKSERDSLFGKAEQAYTKFSQKMHTPLDGSGPLSYIDTPTIKLKVIENIVAILDSPISSLSLLETLINFVKAKRRKFIQHFVFLLDKITALFSETLLLPNRSLFFFSDRESVSFCNEKRCISHDVL